MAETDYRDWKDFTNRVARVIVESEDDTSVETLVAMDEFNKVSPYYLCVSLTMALNEIERLTDA